MSYGILTILIGLFLARWGYNIIRNSFTKVEMVRELTEGEIVLFRFIGVVIMLLGSCVASYGGYLLENILT